MRPMVRDRRSGENAEFFFSWSRLYVPYFSTYSSFRLSLD